MRIAAALPLLFVCLGPARAGPPEDRPAEITKGELQAFVKALASEEFEGRESGEPGCDLAAELVAAEFARVGLEPLGDEGGWSQKFSIPRGVKVLPTSALEADEASGKVVRFDVGQDFSPLDLSARGDVTAAVVFAGYGISAPDVGYDDYEGIDVKGKVVVVLRHAPAYQDKKGPFATPSALQRYAAFQAKAEAAAGAGAAALVIVNDPATFAGKSDDVLKAPGGSATGKIPVVHLTWKAGRRLAAAIDVPLQRRQEQIDGKIQPRSEEPPGVRLHVKCDLEPDVRRVHNVVGVLRPPDAVVTGAGGAAGAGAETVVVGAHYDHVGRGRFGSLANADGKIHNGADDNASGTSALLEIAGWLAPRRAELRRRVLFLAFSGEELGLLGSKHYVGAPIVPLADTVAMLNLDMVGRLDDQRLFIGGTGTSPAWPDLIDRVHEGDSRLRITRWPGGKAPSDHTSFYERDVPVLFFFTGLHGDYHRPSDDWNTLNYDGQARVARFAAHVALDLATRPQRPQFTRCDQGGFEVGPYLGLAVEQRPDGVYVVNVDEKSPAKKAGFREEDRLVEWNGQSIPDTNALNDLISKAKPGEKAEVVVSRKGKTTKLKVTLGST